MSGTITFFSTPDTLTLPNPTIGESETITYNVKHKITEDNKIHTHLGGGGNAERALLNFHNLTQSHRDSIITFLDAHYNDRITYTDHRGGTHYGYIVSVPASMTVVHNDCKRYSFVLEFEFGYTNTV